MIWVGLVFIAVMTVFAALNLALRVPSYRRIQEAFERRGRSEALERYVVLRGQFLLATGCLRSAATLGLLLVALALAWGDDTGWVWGWRSAVSIVATFLIVLVFSHAIPNAWAKYSGHWLVVAFLPVLHGVRVVALPLIVVLKVFDPLVRRLAAVPALDAKAYADEMERQILDAVSEGERHGAVDEEEKEMIESVIELRDTPVEKIMTPRTDVVAIAKDSDLASAKELIRVTGHSRIPVYDDTIDTILGVLYAKDLLQLDTASSFDPTRVMRKVSFIPETKHVRDLLHEFQEQKVHIAVVLDEYGGTAGLVTIEDILEELVGEIVDEYEAAEPAPMKRIDDCTVEVDARMRIDDLNHELDTRLPEDGDYETIGGFVFSTLGKVPTIGEECAHHNIAIQVIGAEPRRVTRLKLHITRSSDNGGHDA